MRKFPTESERILWNIVRRDQLGAHFRRQQIIDNYIVDFVCLEKRLVIELDGKYHNDEKQKAYDNARTELLEKFGYTILRFPNEDIYFNIDSIIEKIKLYLLKNQ